MPATVQSVASDCSYPLSGFTKLVGLKRHAMRAARKAANERGITLVRYKHGRAFVLGADWLEYLATDDTPNGKGSAE